MRAHNWVALGALLEDPGKPACYLPIAGRNILRASQSPPRQGMSGPAVEFRTKCELAVELIRQQARLARGPHLAYFDGAFALRMRGAAAGPARAPGRCGSSSSPGCGTTPGSAPCRRRSGPRESGEKAAVVRRAAAAAAGGATGAGRGRAARRSSTGGSGRSAGRRSDPPRRRVPGKVLELPVQAVVAYVEGYKKRFTLVTSATGLSGLEMVELFAVRFRQEDGFRDLKQRLGWEECRAWTRNPIERTSQVQWVVLSLMRLCPVPAGGGRGHGLVDAAALE